MLMRGYAKFVLIGLLILGLFCGSAVGANPSLSGVNLSPPTGTIQTTFDFDVIFTDADNDTAQYVNLVINSTEYSMTEFNSSDVNTTDGKKYVYSISGLTVGTYNYNFTSFDGTNFGNLTVGTFTVTNSVPTLSGGVSPTNGNVATTFDFNVIFTDADNNSANYVNVTIDGINYTMVQLNPSDTNTADGKDYTYTMSGFGIAVHNFNFRASDGTDIKDWTGSTFNVGNSGPVLIGSVSPTSAAVGTTFYFNLTFTDADNETATYANVTINGTDYTMLELDPLDVNTTDGKEYTFNKSIIIAGTYPYNFKASDGTNVENTSGTFFVDVSNHIPVIINDGVSWSPDSTVSSTFYFNATYKDVDNNASAYMYAQISGTNYTMLKVNPSDNDATDGIDYSYNTTGLSVGDHSYYFLTSDGTFDKNTTPATVTVNSKTFYTGDLIWDALSSQSLVYTWTARSYSGFYYDLDSDMGSETLTITLTSSSVGSSVVSGDLVYTTTPINTNFEYTGSAGWTTYNVAGFMAEKYFAGYPVGAFGITSSIDLMSRGQLSKVLIDRDKSQSIYSGAGLILEEGYVLHVDEVDINGNNVMVTLQKDGSEITSDIVAGGGDFVYKKQLGSTNNVPIIAVHFKNIFRGTETNAVFVDGIFQISDEYTAIRSGDTYGKMKVTNVASGNIKMENSNSFSLSQGSTIDIMGNLKFIVADDNTLRFTPFVDMSKPGSYELRGTVANNTGNTWTPLNFEGFYYNIDEGISTETLKLTAWSGRTIASNILEYTSIPKSVNFDYSGWTTYNVAGFMAEKYFAGYPLGAFGISSSVNLISNGQLSKVLIDGSDSRSIYSGAGLILDEGYVLHIDEVDINGNNVLVTLQKDGSDVKTDIVGGGGDFVYKKQIGSTRDVPMIAVHFKNIFRGSESNAVFVDGIFQISDQYITVEVGETYGKMEVTSTSGKIEMKNDNSITLSQGQTIPIMGDILFKVADDSNNVRYYPYVEIETAPLESLEIDIPSSVKQGDYVTVAVTSRGATVSDVAVKFDDDNIGKTSAEGTISYKPSLSGMYTVTAEKSGYISASDEIEVISPMDETKKMSIEVYPEIVYEGNQLTISVIKAIGGEAIEGVDVSYDGRSLGTTSSDGTLSYTVKETGMHKLIATKTGHLDAELNLEVLALEAKFEFSNLVISPLEVKMGKDVMITLDASNTGKAAGDYNIDLMVDGNLTGSQEVTLAVGNSTTIEFIVVKDEPGTYLVEVNGLSGTFVVLEKAGGTAIYVLGILGVFAAAAVGYMFTAGGWTVEMVTAKVAEFIESVR